MGHTMTDKIRILTWHRDNGSIQNKTAKRFKVSTTTIRSWLKQHPEIAESKPNEKAVERIELSRAQQIIRFEEKQVQLAEDVCKKAYERIMDLIPKEKSIYNLVTVIEKLDPRNLNKDESSDSSKGEDALLTIIMGHRDKWISGKNQIEEADAEEV